MEGLKFDIPEGMRVDIEAAASGIIKFIPIEEELVEQEQRPESWQEVTETPFDGIVWYWDDGTNCIEGLTYTKSEGVALTDEALTMSFPEERYLAELVLVSQLLNIAHRWYGGTENMADARACIIKDEFSEPEETALHGDGIQLFMFYSLEDAKAFVRNFEKKLKEVSRWL